MPTETSSDSKKIIAVLEENPEGLSSTQISKISEFKGSYKALQRLLSSLVADGLVLKAGEKRGRKYYAAQLSNKDDKGQLLDKTSYVFSPKVQKSLRFLDSPPHHRELTSYNRVFLDSYESNRTEYVSKSHREQLYKEGKRFDKVLAAGTYAREISQRLFIDLSYNSSRLEGNTYSRLDTQKLMNYIPLTASASLGA